MAAIRFLSAAGACLAVFLLGAFGQDDTEGDVPLLVSEVRCLTEMNEARKEVGFQEFTRLRDDNMGLPMEALLIRGEDSPALEQKKKFWDAVCSDMQPEANENQTVEETLFTPKGAYAYFPQTGETADCKAAVEYWKGGFAHFGMERPPTYEFDKETKRSKEPYDSDRALSFVALYNPKDNPKVDCGFVKCSAKKKKVEVNGEMTETVIAEAANALLCLSTPTPLEDNQYPYTEAEWKKITNVFASTSASAAAPTCVALAVAALGLCLV